MTASDVVVVGGGPAGLATAALLRREGVEAVVLEAGAGVGAAWRGRYDRLRLHTPRLLSGLPAQRIPRRYGRWVARDSVVRYLEEYAREQAVALRPATRAQRVDPAGGVWLVTTTRGPFRARHVVVATGYCNVPWLPDWPGRERYRGRVLHSSEYRGAAPFRGRDVLVVGCGNSGAEIAVDLAEGGASRVRIAIRTPPQIVKRAPFGVPAQLHGIVLERLPAAAAAAVERTARRLTIPDLSAYGLPRPAESLRAQFARTGTIPILDVGFVDAVRHGRVEVVASVEGLDGGDVVLADGHRIAPEVVIAATGFRPGLEPLVGHLGVLDARGLPRSDEPEPGLHFVGFRATLGGMLRQIGIEARLLAKAISREQSRRGAERRAVG